MWNSRGTGEESSSSLVALLTEGDGEMDEEMTSKLIELSEKLNSVIRNTRETIEKTSHKLQKQQMNNNYNTTYSGYHLIKRGFRETTISSL